MRLLDLGAGRGAVTGPALARGAQVTAIDAAPRMVTRLAAEHPEANVQLMDVHQLVFADASFDVVVAAFVVHLVDSPALAVAEVLRVLSPGVLVAIAIPGGELQSELAEPDPVPGLCGKFAQYLPPGRLDGDRARRCRPAHPRRLRRRDMDQCRGLPRSSRRADVLGLDPHPRHASLRGRPACRPPRRVPRPHAHPSSAARRSSPFNEPQLYGRQRVRSEALGSSRQQGGWPVSKTDPELGRGLSSSESRRQ
ncbi:MAG: class I SAM-dependent methyltransferase [Dermatophilaceae bacterium]